MVNEKNEKNESFYSWLCQAVSTPEFVAGWISGSVGIFFTQPLDVARIRMQVPSIHQSSTIIGQFRQIIHSDGIRGVFRGVGSPTLSVGLMSAILFHSYESGKTALSAWRLSYERKRRRKEQSQRIFRVSADSQGSKSDSPSVEAALLREWKRRRRNEYLDMTIAGMWAGTVSTLITCPTELVKCVVQLEEGAESATIREELSIARKLGFNTFRGLQCTIARDSVAFGVYFPLYHWWCDKFGSILLISSMATEAKAKRMIAERIRREKEELQREQQQKQNDQHQNQNHDHDHHQPSEENAMYKPKKMVLDLDSLKSRPSAKFQTDYVIPFSGGGMSGLVSWFVVYPMDVAKTQYQTRAGLYKYSLIVGLKHQLQFRGLLSFYKGCNATILRAGIQHGLVFICYEWLKRELQHNSHSSSSSSSLS